MYNLLTTYSLLIDTVSFMPRVPIYELKAIAKRASKGPAEYNAIYGLVTTAGAAFSRWRETYYEADPITWASDAALLTPPISQDDYYAEFGSNPIPWEASASLVLYGNSMGKWLSLCDWNAYPNYVPLAASFIDRANWDSTYGMVMMYVLWCMNGLYQVMIAYEAVKLAGWYQKPGSHKNGHGGPFNH
jgi:hypothetical protein